MSEVSRYVIYGLVDPRDGRLRYVGQSSKGLKRPVEHWKSSRCLKARDHCHSWVRGLLDAGHVPSIVIIHQLDGSHDIRARLNDAEVFWISYFRSCGCDLTNMSAGGTGTTGVEPWCKGRHLSEEHRRKIGEKSKGRTSPLKGKSISESQRKAISKANSNRVFSEETRRKIGEASSKREPWNKGLHPPGTPHTEEFKQKMRGRTLPDEVKLKMSISAKLRWENSKLPRLTRVCFECGKPIQVVQGSRRHKQNRVFCSRVCVGKHSHD